MPDPTESHIRQDGTIFGEKKKIDKSIFMLPNPNPDPPPPVIENLERLKINATVPPRNVCLSCQIE